MEILTRTKIKKRIKSALEKAEESKQQFRTLVENIPGTTYRCLLDESWTMLYISSEIQNLTGYQKSDFIGENPERTFASLMHPDDIQPIWENTNKAINDKRPYINEYRIIDKSGSTHFVYARGQAVFNEEGNPIYLDGTIFDITERKLAEQKLKESERDFRSIFENASNGIATIDSDTGRFLRINQSYCDMVKYSQREILEMDFQKITHPDDLQEDLDNMNLLKAGQIKNYSMDKRYLAKDGSIVWVNLTVIPLEYENDKLITHMAIVDDITERKQSDEFNRESAERARLQRNLIAKLSFEDEIVNKPIDEALKILTTKFAEILKVERTSVWMLSDDDKFLKRKMLFDNASGIDSQPEVLETAEFPTYIKALYKDSQIDANEAQNDPRTKELNESYFIPLQISSMLDSAIQRDGRIIGVLSAEHRGPVRQWHADEKSFVSALTNMIAQLFANAERKLAQDKLLESEKLMRKIAENYPNSYISIIEKDFTVGFTSGQEFTNQDLDPEKFIGLNIEQVFGDNTPLIRDHYTKTFKGEEQSFELIVDKQYQHYRTVPLYSEDGTVQRILSVVENITERKNFVKTLKERNEYIESIMENMPIGFAINTISDGEVKYMNDRFEEIYGWSRDILTNTSIFFEKVFPEPEYREKMQEQIIADMQSGDPKRMHWDDLKIVTSAGEVKFVHAFNIPLIDQNLMISTVQDVTNRKKAEDELHKHKEHLEELIESRTAELENKNKELEDFNKVFVGRELKMVELKEKIKKLEKDLNI